MNAKMPILLTLFAIFSAGPAFAVSYPGANRNVALRCDGNLSVMTENYTTSDARSGVRLLVTKPIDQGLGRVSIASGQNFSPVEDLDKVEPVC